MSVLVWDQPGERMYETGVDHGVLYPTNASTGAYEDGVAWNGLTAVNESPSGGEAESLYADNIEYASVLSSEKFAGSIEAYTYPDEFAACNGESSLFLSDTGGTITVAEGVLVSQQERRKFGFSYRTLIGNDVKGVDYGSVIHIVYGAQVAPSEKNHQTIGESPEAATLSWEFSTTPVAIPGMKPSAHISIDTTKITSAQLTSLKNKLYGTESSQPELPTPAELVAMFAG